MFKCNFTLDSLCGYRILYYLLLFFLFKKFKYSLSGCCHLLHHICDLGNLLNRLCEVLHVLYKCLDITYLDSSSDRQSRT